MKLFRPDPRNRYARRPRLPFVRRRNPLRYHMKHQFGTRDTAFRQTMVALTGAELTSGNRIDVLKNGNEIFPSMLRAIAAAARTINMESYIYWDGSVGREFAQALAQRARAGVEVKLILDAVGSAPMSPELETFLRTNGIDIEKYHPIRWYTLTRLNHRTHRKLLIVDGRVGFTGGVGIADEWLGNADAEHHWRDTQVRVEGPAVLQMQYAFMDNWVKSRGELLTGLDYFPEMPPAGEKQVQVIKSSPSEGSSAVKLLYTISIVSAVRSIWISNAYFIPDRDTIRALEAAVRRGVDVKVIVPGRFNDVPVVRQASRFRYEYLLRRGIRLFEYQGTMMHAKTMVVDGVWSTIGSSNFDDRSFRLNDEVNVNIYDEEIGDVMEAMFEHDLGRSVEIHLRTWRKRHWLNRIKEKAADLIKPQL